MSTDEPFPPPKVPLERPGPTGGARARNRAARTAELCEAALTLFLERGVVAVTIGEITSAAGVAKGSFYRYFDHKEQLVETLMAPLGGPLLAALEQASQAIASARTPVGLLAAYQGLAGELIALLDLQPALVRLYLQERQGPPHPAREPFVDLARQVTDHAIAMTRAAQDQGLLIDVDPRVSARVVLGGAQELLLAMLRGDTLGAPEATAAALVQVVLQGVTPRSDTLPTVGDRGNHGP